MFKRLSLTYKKFIKIARSYRIRLRIRETSAQTNIKLIETLENKIAHYVHSADVVGEKNSIKCREKENVLLKYPHEKFIVNNTVRMHILFLHKANP